MPHADIALKISKILNMSLESLLGEENVSIIDKKSLSQSEIEGFELDIYRKNKIIIDALEELPVAVRDSMQDLVLKIRDSCLEKK